MIFDSVKQLISKDEFLEKILIYIRLVEVFAEREGVIIPTREKPSDDVIVELENIGVVETSNDIPELKTILKKDYIHTKCNYKI